MKKLMVYLDDDFHEDLKELAHRKKTSMAALVRYAVDRAFEDELDEISSARAFEEMMVSARENMTLEQYMERRGLALPHRDVNEGSTGPGQVAERRSSYGV
jgi:hypothetical protein